MIRVDGLTYYEVKVRAGLFGGTSRADRLTQEQRQFVGLLEAAPERADTARLPPERWLQSRSRSHVDEQLEEIARLRDIAPGWYALARRIVEDDGGKSS